jgi:hypothetical protein
VVAGDAAFCRELVQRGLRGEVGVLPNLFVGCDTVLGREKKPRNQGGSSFRE